MLNGCKIVNDRLQSFSILSNEDLDFVKTRTKEAALSSYRNYNNNALQDLSKEEFLVTATGLEPTTT